MKTQAICAIATPPGSSALGIIRISGNDLKDLTKQIFSKDLINRKATLVSILDDKSYWIIAYQSFMNHLSLIQAKK